MKLVTTHTNLIEAQLGVREKAVYRVEELPHLMVDSGVCTLQDYTTTTIRKEEDYHLLTFTYILIITVMSVIITISIIIMTIIPSVMHDYIGRIQWWKGKISNAGKETELKQKCHMSRDGKREIH